MTQDQFDDFSAMLTGVCEMYNKSASPELIGIYWQLLNRYELADVQRAMHQHARNADTGQYMPKPADIVKFIDGCSQSRAGTAWLKVDRAMRSVGGGDSVVFDDPLIHAALAQLGDWPKLCQSPENELHFLQSKFEKHYQALVINQPQTWPRMLIGRYQAENALAGYNQEKPIPIGDVERCRVVFRGGVDSSELVQIGNMRPAQPMLPKEAA